MSSIQILQEPSKVRPLPPSLFATDEIPLTVKQAAAYLGVSRQTVYLWVERKQIPHLRVMGRNIRFLRSDLEPFRAQFRQEVANAETA
jgi:excisionase family DNA binding protein